jgi:hypothetical protein
VRAVQHLNAHQHIGAFCLKPSKLYAFAAQLSLNYAPLDHGIGQFLLGSRRGIVNFDWELEYDGHPLPCHHGYTPQQLITPWCYFIDLQISWPVVVGASHRSRTE